MGYFYPPPQPQPPALPNVPQGATPMGNAPPNAEGPDWNIDELRSIWPQEEWRAQQGAIVASQLAAPGANPPFPVPFINAAIAAAIRSAWPQEAWPSQFAGGSGGDTATPFVTPFVPGAAATDSAALAPLLGTWPQESWGTQYPAKIASALAPRNPFAPVLLQSAANVGSGVTSRTATFPQAVTQGSLLVAYTGSTAAGTPAVSDNINGNYNRDVTTGVDGIWSFPGAAASAANGTTVTYTFSASASLYLIIEEWSGQNIAQNPLDKTATNTGTATSGTTGTALNLSQPAELALAMAFVAQPLSSGSVTMNGPFQGSPQSPEGNSAGQLAAGNLVTFSAANVSATFTWTNSVAFRSGIATYKFSTTGGGPVPSPSLTIPAMWPQESWYAQSEAAIASGIAHLQQPPIYVPNSNVAAFENIRNAWPIEYWTAQTSGPIGGWYVPPITPLPFPVAHPELLLWPQEDWRPQTSKRGAPAIAFGLPGVPFVSIGEQMAIRMLWPQEAWGAQTQAPVAAIPQVTVSFPQNIRPWTPALLWPQESWSAQTGANVAAQLAPLFVPPLANPIPPTQLSLVSLWPKESWPAQTASILPPPFVAPNPNILIVPNVIGMYFYDAQQALLGAGFRINTPVLASTPESTTLGIVLAQSIPAKTLVPRANPPQITITVAAYLSELPPQTP